MFKNPGSIDSTWICQRCQYWIARRWLPSNYLHRSGSSSKFGTWHSKQREAQKYTKHDRSERYDRDELYSKSASYKHRTWGSDRRYGSDPGIFERPIKLHRKDPLGVESLGLPAEVLVVTSPDRERDKAIRIDQGDEQDKQEPPNSAEEMLENIEAEQGKPSERGIATNLEHLRDTWVSQRKRKGRPLGIAEYEDLVQEVLNSFTVKQLVGYYSGFTGEMASTPASNLDQPYSGSRYIRSHWTMGSTPFPGNASTRLGVYRSIFGVNNSIEEDTHGEALGNAVQETKKALPKRAIVERILAECWQLRTAHNEEALGELDVWIQPEHNDLLINHDRGIFRRLSEKYGAKIDTSKSENVIRITADRGVCSDLLGMLVYVLHRIEKEVFELSSSQSLLPRASETLNTTSLKEHPKFFEEIQQLTNTVIKPITSKVARQMLSNKVIIYYLGPAKDDLVDARRLLSQYGQTTSVRSRTVHWGAPPGDVSAVPIPVDVGLGLPLAKRGEQWSRWVLPESRKVIPVGWSMAPQSKPHEINMEFAQMAYKSQIIDRSSMGNVIGSRLSCSPATTFQTASVSFGHILYPTKVIKRLKVAAQSPTSERLSSAFTRTLKGPRQFLTNNLGVKSLPSTTIGGNLRYVEELLIRLTPRPMVTNPSDVSAPIPDLEIRVLIDTHAKATRMRNARLIFETRQSDLLLPDQPVDLRFSTDLYTNAANSFQDFSPLENFISASNLNVWGTERLKTPPYLTIPNPRYASLDLSRNEEQDTDGNVGATNINERKDVEYAFSSLEHKSALVQRWGEYIIEYFVIEAGRAGGRREGTRIITDGFDLSNQGSALARVANAVIAHPRTMEYADSEPELIPDFIPPRVGRQE